MMLDVKNLSISYGYITALTDVDFNVKKGEIVTLIGSNGAGKTTSLMGISNLIAKESGRITFKGKNITNMTPDKIVKMGMSHVPEGRRIFPGLTVYENLIAGTLGNPTMGKEEIGQVLDYVYTLFPRLKDRNKQAGGTLSGGEQQMLAIGRGLMMEPDILMLDEPSLGLAPIIIEEVFELLEVIRSSGKTILLIEQNASMALATADRGYVLETGKVVLEGSGKDLLQNKDVMKAYLGG